MCIVFMFYLNKYNYNVFLKCNAIIFKKTMRCRINLGKRKKYSLNMV